MENKLSRRELKALKRATKKYIKEKYSDFYRLIKNKPFGIRFKIAMNILFKKEV